MNGDVFIDAKSRIDYLVERYQRFSDVDWFEQSDAIIAGINGTLLVDQETDITRGIIGMYKGFNSNGTPKCSVREIDFDHNGQIWVIQMDSISSFAESDKPDFNHIVDTFKLLG
jgi:hypothetical protein